MQKRAVITVRLVDESVANSNGTIAEEVLKWFRENSLPPPWVKEVEAVAVADSQAPNHATRWVRKYPMSPLARKHRNVRNSS